MEKVFSFDAETNGLWGGAWAIGALVFDEQGAEIARFLGRLPDEAVTADWWYQTEEGETLTRFEKVRRVVPVTHQTYDQLLTDFAKFYLANKGGADVIVHMGVPVEAKLLIDMHAAGLIGDWDGPYPLLDVAGCLEQVGEDPTSVDSYARKYELSIGDFGGGTHHPLYDSAVTAAVYRHLMSR